MYMKGKTNTFALIWSCGVRALLSHFYGIEVTGKVVLIKYLSVLLFMSEKIAKDGRATDTEHSYSD
ncbi:hypothetical protein KDI_40180 [Dictyobacter arantiisoli]|uniref:Uncharacterized protein n=1 Tax=Dictyobacter arantiisoli TaxID=2014874 RepID=A0A5A5THL2_9CHLR|nr:hypothetical protein KDI_40180 [Dictyobacter arantiisoli]